MTFRFFSLLPFEGHPRGNLPSGMSGQPLHYVNLCVCVSVIVESLVYSGAS